jgi:hypothetical protein
LDETLDKIINWEYDDSTKTTYVNVLTALRESLNDRFSE